VSKFKKKHAYNALIRHHDGSTGFTTIKSAHRKVRCGIFAILPDGSFQPTRLSAAVQGAPAEYASAYRFYQEQIKEGAWKRLIGSDKIRAKEAKHIPFAGDITKLGLFG
jgi:hypothetical protein